MSSVAGDVKRVHGGKNIAGKRKLRARLRMSYFSDQSLRVQVESIEVRRRILMICKQSYRNQFEQGMLARTASQYLRGLADALMDDECNLDEWQRIEEYLRQSGQLSKQHQQQQEQRAPKKWSKVHDMAKANAKANKKPPPAPGALQRGGTAAQGAKRGSMRFALGAPLDLFDAVGLGSAAAR